jgi:recombinational DNA repair protein (RecF pathway)
MSGETAKCEALCLAIYPWSRTSHVVSWLTPSGVVKTVVKGAVRPKSMFLGQYDLNYTCDIVYYARAKGELHALRECFPVDMREHLRGNWRALALADYVRSVTAELAPSGAAAGEWYDLAARTLDSAGDGVPELQRFIAFELEALALAGVKPDFSGYDRERDWSAFSVEGGAFGAPGRSVRVSRETADFLNNPLRGTENRQIPLDAARVIGVFYTYHLDSAAEVRRAALRMISNNSAR